MKSVLKVSELEILDTTVDKELIPEEEYLSRRKQDVVAQKPDKLYDTVLPAPEGVTEWHYATYEKYSVLFASAGDKAYVIYPHTKYGTIMCRYLYSSDGTLLEAVYSKFYSIIQEEQKMANLRDFAQNAPAQSLNPMDFSTPAPSPAAPELSVGNEVPEGSLSPTRAQSREDTIFKARAYGYIAGYIVSTAPRVVVGRTIPEKTQPDRVVPVFRQTKPSAPKAVAISLPQNVCMRGGMFADPTQIDAGMVDVDLPDTETVQFLASPDLAKSLLNIFGYLPELNEKGERYDSQSILHEDPSVNRVFIKTRMTKKGASQSIRSTRKTLFNKTNFFPLSVTRHVSAKPKTAEAARMLNDIAFEPHRIENARMKNTNAGATVPTYLDCMIATAPKKIWQEELPIEGAKDGATYTAVRSVFFLDSPTATIRVDGNEVSVTGQTPMYTPWDAPKTTVAVTELAKRIIVRASTDANGKAIKASSKYDMVKYTAKDATEVLRMPEYRAYKPFHDSLISGQFTTEAELETLSKRGNPTTKRRDTDRVMAGAALEEKKRLLKDSGVRAAIEAMNNEIRIRKLS